MKRFFAFAALVLGLAACQTEPEGLDVNVGGEVDTTITVSLPETTRAADSAEGAFVNVDLSGDATIRYILKIYQKVGDEYKASNDRQVEYSDGQSVVFPVRLVPNRDYRFVVWADYVEGEADVDYHYNTADLTKIELMGEWNPMDETRDAFTGVYCTVEAGKQYTGTSSINILLKRPFAKLRVITTDMKELGYLGIEPHNAAVTYTTQFHESFNALYGEYGAETVSKAHTSFTIKAYDDNKANESKVLFTDYFFADDSDVVKFVMNVNEANGALIKSNTFNTDIAVQRNYLTTIKGNILTDGNNVNVTVDPAFENGSEWNPSDDKYDVEVWDGKTLSVPSVKNDIYEIERPSELAWLAAAVNGTLETRAAAADSFAGKTFVLTQDIDLGGEAWTPIGSNGNIFKGTFDGQNHVVANLVVRGGNNSDQGFFGVTHDGEIKNLVVENANVAGRLNVGVVAGNPYTSKYTNITVQGHVEVNGMAYVGGVGGKNAYADWTNITVDVDETSYVKANSIENGTAYRTYVGGVVGFNGEGGHSFKNITSNINVKGSTCDVGGLFGIAHYGNQFENCSCSGDVGIYAAEEAAEAEEIGGIAGVWHNEDNTEVVMTNVVFTGNVTTNIERKTVWYGNLVGKYYEENDLGVLTLNGLKFTRNGADFSIINDILTREAYTMPFDLTGNAKASNGYGATGINHANYTLDGGYHTLKVSAGGTWGSAIATTGGTIKNITIAKGFRGIFINNGTERVILENVTIDGTTYTISCDKAGNQGITATNSTFNGWTSYAATIGEAYFENCSFGEGAGNKFARPYAPTTFKNCDFCEGYKVDPRAKVTFVNCRLNGVDLTAENLSTLVTSNFDNANLGAGATTTETLKAAVSTVGASVYVEAGEYTFPSSVAEGVTINCAEGTVFTGNSKLNIKGATVIGAEFKNEGGSAVSGTINGTFKNCNFTGSNALRSCYAGETVVFENCVFSGNTYGVHFDGGANDATFKDCVFSGFNAFGAELTQLTLDGCTFVGNDNNSYNGANLWGRTTLKNCEFTFDGSVATEWIDCVKDGTASFRDCTVNGEPLTVENISDLTSDADASAFTLYDANGRVILDANALYTYSEDSATVTAFGEGAVVYRGILSEGAAGSIKSINVGEGIVRLNNRCFCKDNNLVSVALPNSLTYIDEGVFQQSGFKSITIPENVTFIGKQAFGACGELETIVINAKKVTIDNYVARACAKLKSVYIYSEDVEFINKSMYFTNKENADASAITFYVSSQAVADKVYDAQSTSHSYGIKIVSIDGTTTYYNTLK